MFEAAGIAESWIQTFEQKFKGLSGNKSALLSTAAVVTFVRGLPLGPAILVLVMFEAESVVPLETGFRPAQSVSEFLHNHHCWPDETIQDPSLLLAQVLKLANVEDKDIDTFLDCVDDTTLGPLTDRRLAFAIPSAIHMERLLRVRLHTYPL